MIKLKELNSKKTKFIIILKTNSIVYNNLNE